MYARREYLIKLVEVIEELKEEVERGIPIIVEGKKDIESLKILVLMELLSQFQERLFLKLRMS